MKSLQNYLFFLFLTFAVTSFSQFNIGLYTGFEVSNFSFMESDPNDPVRFGYSSNESESFRFTQNKIGLILENVIGERLALVWALEVAQGNEINYSRQALDVASNNLLDVSVNEKINGYKIGLGVDYSVYGEIHYDPLQILVSATFIQQFSLHKYDSDLANVKSREVSFLYAPYNHMTWEEPNSNLSFGTFFAIGPKVNYQLNDNFMIYGTGKYNLNLISSDGGDLIHNNGFFMNFGIKFMVY